MIKQMKININQSINIIKKNLPRSTGHCFQAETRGSQGANSYGLAQASTDAPSKDAAYSFENSGLSPIRVSRGAAEGFRLGSRYPRIASIGTASYPD